jgi:hypothetical protein
MTLTKLINDIEPYTNFSKNHKSMQVNQPNWLNWKKVGKVCHDFFFMYTIYIDLDTSAFILTFDDVDDEHKINGSHFLTRRKIFISNIQLLLNT